MSEARRSPKRCSVLVALRARGAARASTAPPRATGVTSLFLSIVAPIVIPRCACVHELVSAAAGRRWAVSVRASRLVRPKVDEAGVHPPQLFMQVKDSQRRDLLQLSCNQGAKEKDSCSHASHDHQFGVHLSHKITPLPPIENFSIPRCEFTSQLCVADVTTLCFGTRRSVR
eukprot:COSAG06_NODE_3080_length_5886_cov_10.248834_1_plen_172_part_00